VALLILDGWGYREESDSNAIAAATTPVWDRLWAEQPRTLLSTSGASVGLPGGQMGNSEVGHVNLGAGRVVYQEFTRISRSIRTGSFFTNRTLTDAVDRARANGAAVHIMGLLSPGGVHSHEEHIQAMLRLAVERGAQRVYLHAFLDGRDTAPRSAQASLESMQALMDELGGGRFAGIVGRYYAMDRDNRWPRIRQAYAMSALGRAPYRAADALSALQAAYERGENDEFAQPTLIQPQGTEPVRMHDGDTLVFMNYRSDRARQLTRTFIEEDFSGFERGEWPHPGVFVSLTEYNRAFDIPVAFLSARVKNGFGEYIAKLGLRQLRLAETEKYAHVTFFFNGGTEQPFDGEDHVLVPSLQVATYDLQPHMCAEEVTVRLVMAIESGKYDAIVCNYANADMLGHTGNLAATVRAIETVDHCLGRVVRALHQAGGAMLITADHGNAELMFDPAAGQPHTAHTSNPVPLLLVGGRGRQLAADGGSLCDVAPTLLALMGLEQPAEMSGRSLIAESEGAT
jgi:2,3-bisphosphoglycerate-independent phosphoglycerate mutase